MVTCFIYTPDNVYDPYQKSISLNIEEKASIVNTLLAKIICIRCFNMYCKKLISFLHKCVEGQGVTINSRPLKFHLLIRLCYVEACILH